MAAEPIDGGETPVVTLETLETLNKERPPRGTPIKGRPPGGLESTGLETAARTVDLRDEYDRLVDLLEGEAAKVGGRVMFTAQDAQASRLQSAMAERADQPRPLETSGLEAKFGEGPKGGDWWGWLSSVIDHRPSFTWRDIKRPSGSGVTEMPDDASVAMLSDWGTGLYGAPVSAASIRKQGGYHLLLHLGDIYYSGTKKEVDERFLKPWPTDAGKISRALNGNHEMYSGGYAYFDGILPAFGQESSYFAFRNKHWLLVGLDTAHTDHDLDDTQAAWLKTLVDNRGGRKVVLASHHQPFSRLDAQGPKLTAAVSELLAGKKIAAWYWGHEHDCVVYDRHPVYGLLGRCIGNGGIPAPWKSEVREAATKTALHGIEWKRLDGNADAPGCLVLDGPNPYVTGEEKKFCPHGYLTLDFDGPQLVERIRLPNGAEIYRNTLT